MKCEQVMTSQPECCIPGDSVSRAAKLMKIEDVGSIPICQSQENRNLVGIITDRDLAVQVVAEGRDPHMVKIQDVMTREPFTCHPGDDVQTALDAMERHQVRRIPVVDSTGRLVGIISQADIATRFDQPQKPPKWWKRSQSHPPCMVKSSTGGGNRASAYAFLPV